MISMPNRCTYGLSNQEDLERERTVSNGDLVLASGNVMLCDRQKQVPDQTLPPSMPYQFQSRSSKVCLFGCQAKCRMRPKTGHDSSPVCTVVEKAQGRTGRPPAVPQRLALCE